MKKEYVALPNHKPLPAGAILQEYVIDNVLGKGGFGITYLATDSNLNKRFAIKEFYPRSILWRDDHCRVAVISSDYKDQFSKGLSTFLNEARLLSLFNHPNIARINRYFEANGTGYFVMDYESGTSLRTILSRQHGQFEEQEIEAIVVPLCNGLEQLHRQSLIHRDIKPDNIVIRPDGSPVLIDFGAAINLRALYSCRPELIMTPHYAPIEQYDLNLPQGPWIDVYALAATLYELISGAPPPQALHRVKNDTLVSATQIGRGKYGDRLLGLIDKGLSINFAERPNSISEFLRLLQLDDDKNLKIVINGLSEKTIHHFLCWAKPNSGLYIDEFVAFSVCFPIIDLSWRIGRGTPTKDLFIKLYQTLDHDLLERCRMMFVNAGFTTCRRNLTLKTVESRIDEYAATYLLDRQEEKWTYEQTRKQCAKNCLTIDAKADIEGFVELLEDIINRTRGRVKKEFEKAFRNVNWIMTSNGWKKEIRHFN